MAKDVDLSSQEWLDIVFDGKNKDFGAYEMRAATTKRHTKAVIIVLIIIGLISLGLGIAGVVSKYAAAESEGPDAGVEQQLATYDAAEEEEEEDEMEDIQLPEEKPEEMLQEEVANQIQNTVIDIVEDDKVVNEVKTQDELREDDRQVGVQDISDGVDDLTKKVVKDEVIIVEEKKEVKDEIVYTTANVQQQPQFPGGEAAMYKWLSDHIQYPPQAAEEGVDGRVTVQFVVTKTGAIENVQVVRPRHPALDKEAVRVVKAMPAWNPGRNNGQPVKVTFVLPVTFKLQK